MRIVGFSIKKVLAEKLGPAKGQIQIKSGLDIKDISEEKVIQSEEPHLRFDFTFSVDYLEGLGKIEISGLVLVLDDEDQSKEILKEWKKKKFVHAMKLPLFNFIMDKCNIKALNLEEQLGLPYHLPFPKITASAKASEE